VVTALVSSRETYEVAIAVFGADRVYAPSLLRLRRPTVEAKNERAA